MGVRIQEIRRGHSVVYRSEKCPQCGHTIGYRADALTVRCGYCGRLLSVVGLGELEVYRKRPGEDLCAVN